MIPLEKIDRIIPSRRPLVHINALVSKEYDQFERIYWTNRDGIIPPEAVSPHFRSQLQSNLES